MGGDWRDGCQGVVEALKVENVPVFGGSFAIPSPAPLKETRHVNVELQQILVLAPLGPMADGCKGYGLGIGEVREIDSGRDAFKGIDQRYIPSISLPRG